MIAPALLFFCPSALALVPVEPTPDCRQESQETCLVDFEDKWELSSWIPEASQDTIRPAEVALGAGIAADVAWRTQVGRWDVPVAVLDSGIEWGKGELRAKVRINIDELPPPQRSDGSVVEDYDLDGNGLVNVDDYVEDARVDWDIGSDDADGYLDPSDLIFTFSDGVDDDGNGFTDDIAGWDFFNYDNNPYAVDGVASYHGSGIMRDAAGEGGGVCPNCSVVPIRVGDGFITDGDRIAMGIAYATDIGARSVGMALGGLSVNTMLREAIDYADANGVVLVANPGDENSYHRNLPGVVEPMIYVHAVRGDNQAEPDGAYSFLNFPNCNNYGPRPDLVASSEGCGSGATARTAGAAALMISTALNHGTDLTPTEVRALMVATAEDVHLSEDEVSQADTYPSAEGWDPFFNNGRLNVGRAVQAIEAGEIPPYARIQSPDWYTWTLGEPFTVEGIVDAPRAGDVSWVIEAGLGLDPQDWVEVGGGQGPVDGVMAEVDPAQFGWDNEFPPLTDLDIVERYYRAHEPLLTLRLTATDDKGREAVVRRGVWVDNDPNLLPGFPVNLGSSAEASPVMADLDGDGVLEVIAASSDGGVHALNGTGEHLPGFPVYTDPIEVLGEYAAAGAYSSGAVALSHGDGIMATPAVGDIDGDGAPEIVAATMRGRVFAWEADGTPVAGFPVAIQGRENAEYTDHMAWDEGVAAAPSLGDVDGDGALDIVVGGMDQRLYVWGGDGSLFSGYPLELCVDCGSSGARILSSPALGDIDGDGDLDAALGTNELPQGDTGVLWLIDLKAAAPMGGWPQTRDGLINEAVLPVLGEGHPGSTALADVDGDGDLEIASFAMLGTTGVIQHDGSDLVDVAFTADRFPEDVSFADASFFSVINSPAFGDMDQDGQPELLMGGASLIWTASLATSQYLEYQQAFGIWDLSTGDLLPTFPQQVEDVSFLASPSVADVTGDGKPEALFGTGGYFLNAFSADGSTPSGWPKFTGGWIMGGPSIGDVDGDGYLDVAITTRDGNLFVWCTRGHADDTPEWAGTYHDAANTGFLGTPLPAQIGPPETGGCCSKDGDKESALLALPLLLLGALRRRRSL